jgi:hypothetical protein
MINSGKFFHKILLNVAVLYISALLAKNFASFGFYFLKCVKTEMIHQSTVLKIKSKYGQVSGLMEWLSKLLIVKYERIGWLTCVVLCILLKLRKLLNLNALNKFDYSCYFTLSTISRTTYILLLVRV